MARVKKIILSIIIVLFAIAYTCVLPACNNTSRIETKLTLRFFVDDTVYATVNIDDKGNIKIPQNPEKTGYSFDGWFWDKDIFEKPFTLNSLNNAPLNSNMSVYAKFTQDHEHSFSETWSSNSSAHWHAADCGHDLIKDEATHSFNSQYICTVCKYSKLIYELNRDGTEYSIAGCNICPNDVIIPTLYNGMAVTAIGEKAFYNWWNLKSVVIPNGIKTIGNYAFHYCKGLTSVTISDSVSDIGYQAFWDCDNLTDVALGNGIKAIYDYAFYSCEKLTEITIPNGVEHISASAFSNCDGITSIVIPNSVTYIGQYAFEHCDELKNVTIGSGISYFGAYAFEGCNNLKSVTIAAGVSVIDCTAFQYCDNLKSLYYLGTMEQWNAIVKHNEWYFNGISVESVICSNGTIQLK